MSDIDVNQESEKPINNLPHRYPFLLCDRILFREDNYVKGRKCVSYNEPFFQGHFPQEPVMPGVLIIEALAQISSYLFSQGNHKEKGTSYLVGVNNFIFKKKVVPGDVLILEAKTVKLRAGRYLKASVQAMVDDEVCVQGEVSLMGIPSS